ncbi:hypothetical protein [Diaminobutyricibacter sp. McL0608]|uniref:hypothetical protein n=1 Tax=Leifsonia sp. McL0608 TaxID=3143537 RepID=UPI0031F2D69E
MTAVIDEDNIRSVALARRLGYGPVARTGTSLTFLKTRPFGAGEIDLAVVVASTHGGATTTAN